MNMLLRKNYFKDCVKLVSVFESMTYSDALKIQPSKLQLEKSVKSRGAVNLLNGFEPTGKRHFFLKYNIKMCLFNYIYRPN